MPRRESDTTLSANEGPCQSRCARGSWRGEPASRQYKSTGGVDILGGMSYTKRVDWSEALVAGQAPNLLPTGFDSSLISQPGSSMD